ncbi:MFS transporter [Aliiglaciecola sp. CAU 1673]|uniref:MFS transporter n=1 Tax=Aliiglaciecola sp. CAU 1673 TaxID=3032595 RepID=UPI0023DC078C|nr:MFS transporter [Aliiglaciecola sp. CAU 1673]MDF2177168.1 MFS transporter [Aliiglaciecola sp. CAU 1673]
MNSPPFSHRLYRLLAQAKVDADNNDLQAPAQKALGLNFSLIVCSQILTKLGDLLSSPKIVLTWLLGSIGVSASIISYLVPVRESGSLLPQIFVQAWVKRFAYRRQLWVLGAGLQGLSVLGMAWSVWALPADIAGICVLTLLAMFSLARSVCSLTSKDILGKTIPKKRRGRLSGIAATFAGLLTVSVSLVFLQHQEDNAQHQYLLLLLFAASLWFVAATLFYQIREPAGEQDQKTAPMAQLKNGLSLLGRDPTFRHFVLSRALVMGSGLSAPFIILLAQGKDQALSTFGAFLLAGSLGSSLSATVWGFMADNSSRLVLFKAAMAAASCCLLVFVSEYWLAIDGVWHFALLYFLLSIAHAGVRIGRKTYLVDMAEGNQRTDYVAVSNSIIGLLLLCMGAITSFLAAWSVPMVVLLLGLLCFIGALSALLMKEVE